MIQLLNLLQKAIVITLLDADNAVYMTSAIKRLPFRKQKQAIVWGLLAEFFGRIALVVLFYSLFSENKTLFTLLGIKFTPDSISLFIAGTFLLYNGSSELYEFLTSKEKSQQQKPPQISFPRLMVEMTVVNFLLSIDTIVIVSSRGLEISSIIFIFLVSAIIRLLAIDIVAQFIRKYPSMKIVILIFVILIGFELFFEGLWFKFPEEIFNMVMVLAIIGAIIHKRRRLPPAQIR